MKSNNQPGSLSWAAFLKIAALREKPPTKTKDTYW